MVEFNEIAPAPQMSIEERKTIALHQSAYGEQPKEVPNSAKVKSVTPDEEAAKIIDLAKTRLDTIDSFTGNALPKGRSAAKALADEVAGLTRAQAAAVNTSLIAQYQNMYPTWTPVPTGMVNDLGEATGMEIRASKLDLWPGPKSLQILDNGDTVTVQREISPAKIVDGKQLPPVYIVDAQAARVQS